MNLQNLFELQKQLDEHIEQEHPLKEGENRFAKKILALQVELGELANCWRGFKFWSNDQKPRTKTPIYQDCKTCNGVGYHTHKNEITTEDCMDCEGEGQFIVGYKNPLLEEYVDCLHFILSVGLELGFEKQTAHSFKNGNSILGQFHSIYSELSSLYYHRQMYNYQRTLNLIIGLGELLGFTWEQVEQAYRIRRIYSGD